MESQKEKQACGLRQMSAVCPCLQCLFLSLPQWNVLMVHGATQQWGPWGLVQLTQLPNY